MKGCNPLSDFIEKKQARRGTPDMIEALNAAQPSSWPSPRHSTGRMPLASSSFLRVSSHWVNCLDSRNICQSEDRVQWEDDTSLSRNKKQSGKTKRCTILLYSSKSFFTSWDWASVWSWRGHGGVSRDRNTWRQTEEGDAEGGSPALWYESATGAAAWCCVPVRLWTTQTHCWQKAWRGTHTGEEAITFASICAVTFTIYSVTAVSCHQK